MWKYITAFVVVIVILLIGWVILNNINQRNGSPQYSSGSVSSTGSSASGANVDLSATKVANAFSPKEPDSKKVLDDLLTKSGSELVSQARQDFDKGYQYEACTAWEQELTRGSTDNAIAEALALCAANNTYLQWVSKTFASNSLRTGTTDSSSEALEDAYVIVSNSLVQNQKLDLAKDFNSEDLKTFPNSPRIILNLARILSAQGNHSEAVNVLQQALWNAASNAANYTKDSLGNLYAQLANELNLSGRLQEAQDLANQVRSQFPNLGSLVQGIPFIGSGMTNTGATNTGTATGTRTATGSSTWTQTRTGSVSGTGTKTGSSTGTGWIGTGTATGTRTATGSSGTTGTGTTGSGKSY